MAWKLKIATLILLLLVNTVAWCVALIPHEHDPVPASDVRLTEVELGTPLPEITVYDDQGNEFEIANLRGTYSVVVFGCLT